MYWLNPTKSVIEDFNRQKFFCRKHLAAIKPHFFGLDLANLASVETFWRHGFVPKRPSKSEVQNPFHGGLACEEWGDWEVGHPHSLAVAKPNLLILLILKFHQDPNLFPEIINGFVEFPVYAPSQTSRQCDPEFRFHSGQIVTNRLLPGKSFRPETV